MFRAHERRRPVRRRWPCEESTRDRPSRSRGGDGRRTVRHRRAPPGSRGRPRPSREPRRALDASSAHRRRRGRCRSWCASCSRGPSDSRFPVEHAADPQDGLGRLLRDEHDVGAGRARARRRGRAEPRPCGGATRRCGAADPAQRRRCRRGSISPRSTAGAADFLDKEELEVERLERAIRMALARQRRGAQARPAAALDALTGLASRHAYLRPARAGARPEPAGDAVTRPR